MQILSIYATGDLTVPSLLSFLMPDYQNNLQVKPDEPRIKAEYIYYSSPKGGGKIKALLALPTNTKGKLGGAAVMHENRGLNPFIKNVCRRAAVAGFISKAPDALTALDSYRGTGDKAQTLQSKRDKKEVAEHFIAAYDYLKKHKDCNGKIGVVGFCYGGGIANQTAVSLPNLAASVPLYGGQPPAKDVRNIKAPLLV